MLELRERKVQWTLSNRAWIAMAAKCAAQPLAGERPPRYEYVEWNRRTIQTVTNLLYRPTTDCTVRYFYPLVRAARSSIMNTKPLPTNRTFTCRKRCHAISATIANKCLDICLLGAGLPNSMAGCASVNTACRRGLHCGMAGDLLGWRQR